MRYDPLYGSLGVRGLKRSIGYKHHSCLQVRRSPQEAQTLCVSRGDGPGQSGWYITELKLQSKGWPISNYVHAFVGASVLSFLRFVTEVTQHRMT